MQILITNDDSIYSEGISILVDAAKKYGDVFVVAPKSEQSAKSHAINVRSGFEIEPCDVGLKVPSYTCDSTPADAVRSAKFGLQQDFEIVMSGVNSGFNIGEDILYSGTVSAAMEAVLMGKQALAFSVAPNDFITAKQHLAETLDFIFQNKLFSFGHLFNINIPKDPIGIKITKQGNTNFDTRFDQEQRLYYQRGHHRYHLDQDIESDVWAIAHQYISISPLSVDRTDFRVLKKILEKQTPKE
ncbi:MAG: 5'/3'-nucleotidase SurE [Bacilli bacterium]